jgi:RNA polymerase sigma factor (sigma-70 family)
MQDGIRTISRKAKPSTRLSITGVFVQCSPHLKRFLARFFCEQQDIDDVVQETYLRAYAAVLDKQIEYPKAYLFRIARNIALTELTKKSRQITDYIEDSELPIVSDNGVTAEDEVGAKEQLGIYCEAVAALPEKCRRVYLLRKVHGLSHKEIAERMDLTVSSVEKHLLNGVLRCKAYVEQRERYTLPDRAEPLWGKIRLGTK